MRHDEATMRAALQSFIEGSFTLRIPADERVDPDLILCSAIEEAIASRDRIARLESRLADAEERAAMLERERDEANAMCLANERIAMFELRRRRRIVDLAWRLRARSRAERDIQRRALVISMANTDKALASRADARTALVHIARSPRIGSLESARRTARAALDGVYRGKA